MLTGGLEKQMSQDQLIHFQLKQLCRNPDDGTAQPSNTAEVEAPVDWCIDQITQLKVHLLLRFHHATAFATY